MPIGLVYLFISLAASFPDWLGHGHGPPALPGRGINTHVVRLCGIDQPFRATSGRKFGDDYTDNMRFKSMGLWIRM